MRGSHIGVEVFVHMLPERIQAVVHKLTLLICSVFTGVLTYYASIYFMRLLNSGQLTPGLQVPLCWAFLAVPVGLALMCTHFVIQLFLKDE